LPHCKGVSYKSDNKILRELLENERLSNFELLEKTGLNKDTLSKRLDILEKEGQVARRVLKKHGHYVQYSIPWFKRDQIHYKLYGTLPDWANELMTTLAKTFSASKVSITPDMKINIEVNKFVNISILLSELAKTFENECPWIRNLPFDEAEEQFHFWCQGMLCTDCLKLGPVKPLIEDQETNENICPQCGRVYGIPPIPSIISTKAQATVARKTKKPKNHNASQTLKQ
jgi:DNA-binding HxlR family transcriptional regulator